MKRTANAAAYAYVALSVADTVLAARRGPRARAARHITKPLLMPTLSAAFVAATRDARPAARGLVTGTIAGQVFSWGGDVALLGRSDNAFLAGLSSFFAAHLAYIGGFAGAKDEDIGVVNAGSGTAAGFWFALGPVIAVAAGRQDPRMRVPVAAYGGVLATMAATSTMLDRQIDETTRRTIVAGTCLFLASDAILGARAFLLKSDSRALDAAVMSTYTAAQGLIALGVAKAVNGSSTAASPSTAPTRSPATPSPPAVPGSTTGSST